MRTSREPSKKMWETMDEKERLEWAMAKAYGFTRICQGWEELQFFHFVYDKLDELHKPIRLQQMFNR